MKFIQRYDINVNKWDELVQKNQGLCYHYSWYLDATAKNWGVYTNADYTAGVAVSYNKVLGFKILYPLLFGRTLQFFGMSHHEIEHLVQQMKADFPIGQIQLETPLREPADEIKTYQTLEKTVFNKLTKRMLQKAERNQIAIVEFPWQQSVHLVEQELAGKVKMLRGENLQRLRNLLSALEQQNKLISIAMVKDKLCLGALYMVVDDKRLLYLKGAATAEIKQQGGMYLAMSQQIQFALSKGLTFDFGGSSVPGIKRFFNGFGGEDQQYCVYQWNEAPFWFTIMRKINKLF